MGFGWQACDHLVAASDLARHDRHDRCRQQRETATGDVAADPLDGDDAVAQVEARQRLDLQRQDRRQLRLGEAADIVDRELGIGAGLRIELAHRREALFGRHLEAIEIGVIELHRIIAHRREAGDDRADQNRAPTRTP